MYKKFILNSEELNEIKNQFDSTSDSELGSTENLKENLFNYTDTTGVLKADEIIKDWFPKIKADIFISHSHKDETLVLGLAGWLKKHFGLTAFIDSKIWGYSDELLRKIDDKYCLNDNDNYKNYNYFKRNRSTSHVHMMLSTALMHMIDQCEMFLFIGTQNSFTSSKYLESKGETGSPWIYSELSLVNKISTNIPVRFKAKNESFFALDKSLENFASDSNLQIKYGADISGFKKLTFKELINWKEKTKGFDRPKDNLDALYNL